MGSNEDDEENAADAHYYAETYHNLALPKEAIIYSDTKDLFYKCIGHISQVLDTYCCVDYAVHFTKTNPSDCYIEQIILCNIQSWFIFRYIHLITGM